MTMTRTFSTLLLAHHGDGRARRMTGVRPPLSASAGRPHTPTEGETMSDLASKIVSELRSIPPTTWPQFEAARAEVAQLHARRNDVFEQLDRLRHVDLPAATAADLDAAADALRAGTAAPKTTKAAKAEAEIATLAHNDTVLQVASAQAAEDLAATLFANREAWISGLEQEEAAALEAYRGTVERLAADRQAVVEARQKKAWLVNLEADVRFRGGTPPVSDLKSASGDPSGWPEVVDALRVDLEPARPQAHSAQVTVSRVAAS